MTAPLAKLHLVAVTGPSAQRECRFRIRGVQIGAMRIRHAGSQRDVPTEPPKSRACA